MLILNYSDDLQKKRARVRQAVAEGLICAEHIAVMQVVNFTARGPGHCLYFLKSPKLSVTYPPTTVSVPTMMWNPVLCYRQQNCYEYLSAAFLLRVLLAQKPQPLLYLPAKNS